MWKKWFLLFSAWRDFVLPVVRVFIVQEEGQHQRHEGACAEVRFVPGPEATHDRECGSLTQPVQGATRPQEKRTHQVSNGFNSLNYLFRLQLTNMYKPHGVGITGTCVFVWWFCFFGGGFVVVVFLKGKNYKHI